MSKLDLTEIINEYVCLSNGVAHHCKVQWVASEPRLGPCGLPRSRDVLPEHDGPKTVHLMFQRSSRATRC